MNQSQEEIFGFFVMLKKLTRKRKKELGLFEVVAIALGGMVGGGIFSILGISVDKIGNATPIAIVIGGVLAFFAAFSYVKLALYYKDEGATYSFFKKTFPSQARAASIIGWLIVFGYISTLGLYAFTFASYLSSILPGWTEPWQIKLVATGVLVLFAMVNLFSVKGMGKLEDIMVYTKMLILLIISGLFLFHEGGQDIVPLITSDTKWGDIIIIASITFVAYEGFQLVIHAYEEMDRPDRNVPRAIYIALALACAIYLLLAAGAMSSIPKELIIQDKEYALAAGAKGILGEAGLFVVIFGVLLATSSAISGTIFGASRLMAVIAKDRYFPEALEKRVKGHIPSNAIICMTILAIGLMFSGGLQLLLEFGSITFIMVSFLMALANFKMRKQTKTSPLMGIVTMFGLACAGFSILYYEWTEEPKQLLYICSVYVVLILIALLYGRKDKGLNPLSVAK